MYAYWLIFIAAPVHGLSRAPVTTLYKGVLICGDGRFQEKLNQGVVNPNPEILISVGGFGCSAVLAQLGFLRGLLPMASGLSLGDEWPEKCFAELIRIPYMLLSSVVHAVTASSGSVALGMFASQVLRRDRQDPVHLVYDHKIQNFLVDPLGKWCDFALVQAPNINQKAHWISGSPIVPPEDWQSWFEKCSQCNSDGVCSWDDDVTRELFGVGQNCAVPRVQEVLSLLVQKAQVHGNWTKEWEKDIYAEFAHQDVRIPVETRMSNLNLPFTWTISMTQYSKKFGSPAVKKKVLPLVVRAKAFRSRVSSDWYSSIPGIEGVPLEASLVENIASSTDRVTSMQMIMRYNLQQGACGMPIVNFFNNPTQWKAIAIPLRIISPDKEAINLKSVRFVRVPMGGEIRAIVGESTDLGGVAEAVGAQSWKRFDEKGERNKKALFLSMIVGPSDSKMNWLAISNYFMPRIPLDLTLSSMLGMQTCSVASIKNTNYVLSVQRNEDYFGPNDVVYKGNIFPLTGHCRYHETEQVVVSRDCYRTHIWSQLLMNGMFTAGVVRVVKNTFWNTAAGWELQVSFATLFASKMSKQWLEYAFSENVAADQLSPPSSMLFPNYGEVLPNPLAAFALLNYASYLGGMQSCQLRKFKDTECLEGWSTCKPKICTYCVSLPHLCPGVIPRVLSYSKEQVTVGVTAEDDGEVDIWQENTWAGGTAITAATDIVGDLDVDE